MLETRQTYDARSPVQPGRDRTFILIIVPVVVFALCATWQDWPDLWSQVASELIQGPPDTRDGSLPSPVHDLKNTRSRTDSVAGLFSGDDYPADAADRNEQGTTQVRLSVDASGRVTGCLVIASSGSQSLDGATCRILQSRARFKSAQDQTGRAVRSTIPETVTWRLSN